MESEKITACRVAMELIYAAWRSIPWDTVSPMRRMKIYDEYTSKIKSSACALSLAVFVERLCAKMGIRSIDDTSIAPIVAENSEAVLDALRNETQFVVLLMRERIEAKQDAFAATKLVEGDQVEEEHQEEKEENTDGD